MKIRYYIDPETGLPHIYNHDVCEVEVEEILEHPGELRPGNDNSRIAVGQTYSGRYLRVIYLRETKSNGLFIITAYEL